MEVTVLGMTVFLQPVIKVLDAVSMIALQLSRESYLLLPFSTTIDSKEQYSNALLLMDVTELGIVMLVKPLHPPNALLPMVVTELPMVTLVKPLHEPNA